LKERGNVISQLTAQYGPEICSEFVTFALENSLHLACDRSGVIALTRMYDAAGAWQSQFDSIIVAHIWELIEHPFGNYIVQRIVGNDSAQEILTAIVCSPSLLTRCIRSKFASHVVQRYFEISPTSYFLQTFVNICNASDTLKLLANDKYGNYVLQTALKRLVNSPESPPQLVFALTEVVRQCVHESPHSPNINKAMMPRC